jgi:tetratricopeptide (TPR) repeat protein
VRVNEKPERARLSALVCLFCLAWGSACAPVKPGTAVNRAEIYDHALKNAGLCFSRGDYASLEKAAALYGLLAEVPGRGAKAREKLLRTCMILALREKEIGILDGAYAKKAEELAGKEPSEASELNCLNLVRTAFPEVPGILGDRPDAADKPLEKYHDWARENAVELNAALKQRALDEDFFAYLYLAFVREFDYWIKDKGSLLDPEDIRSPSILVRYKLALVPRVDPEKLESLLQAVPGFAEARLFLGLALLAQGAVVPAEEHFLRAVRSFPRSLSALMGLARTRFYLEEYSSCLELYERMLHLAPAYREALLGKVVCLSSLGRHEEAIETCRNMRGLGKYYLGESHFWEAQNLFNLDRPEAALRSIEDAEKYIYGSYDVLLLGGMVRYALGRVGEAEGNFRDVLKIKSTDVEAAFHLGKISAEKGLWLDSGNFFALAAEGGLATVESLEKKAQEIRASGLSEERKTRMIARKELEVKRAMHKAANSFYNAAAGFHNAGVMDKALECATRALEHPAFKDAAEALIEKLHR